MDTRDLDEDRAPAALVVSEDPWTVASWSEWLEGEGFATMGCPGPVLAWRCHRASKEPCTLRELVDVAVVDLRPHADGGWPERWCVTTPDDGSTVFVAEDPSEVNFRPEELLLPRPVTSASLGEAVRRAYERKTRGSTPSG